MNNTILDIGIRLIFTFSLLFLVRTAYPQNHFKLHGRILDQGDTSVPIPGASVTLKRSGEKTVSNREGEYELPALRQTDTLEITCVGFITAVFPISQNTNVPFDVLLKPDITLLEEVEVSTGYQSLDRARTTGSYYSIDNSLFNQSTSIEIISRLEGISSSLLFDRRDTGTPKIQIRGLGTLYSDAQPLIILDNFPYEGDINNINPNDVLKVTILKDAAASSIWGARAGNGVIVITTKAGRIGESLRIGAGANIQVTAPPDLAKIQVLDPSAYIEMEKMLFEMGHYDVMLDYPMYYPVSPAVDVLADNSLTDEEKAAALAKLKSYDFKDDFSRYIYRQGFNQQYYINFSGGGEKSTFYVSAGYDNNAKELVGNDFKRANIVVKNSYEPFKKVRIYTDLRYTNTMNSNNSPGGYGNYRIGLSRLYPYARLTDDNGKPMSIATKLANTFTDTVGNGQLLDWKYYPLRELQSADNSGITNDLLGNLAIVYQPFSWLGLEARYQYGKLASTNRMHKSTEMYETRDLINKYTNFAQSESELRYPVPIGSILDMHRREMESHSFRTQLNFAKEWGKRGELSAIAGLEIRENLTTTQSSRTYGYDNNTLAHARIDYVNRYPTYLGINGNSLIPNYDNFAGLLYRYVSGYVNGSYRYGGKYTLSMSARRDASNVFGVRSNDKATPLWSAGLAWDLSKEDFFQKGTFDALRFRATYGYSGNVNQGVSALTVIEYYTGSTASLSGRQYANIQNAANPNLRWEKVRMFNAGIDFSLKSKFIEGSVEYYRKRSSDLLAFRDLDVTTGLSNLMTNNGEMIGEGIDVTLKSTLFRGKVKWSLLGLLSYASYKVTSVALYTDRSGYVADGSIIIPIEGYTPYLVVSNRWAGLDPNTGDPLGYLNGEKSSDYAAISRKPFEEQVIHGSGLPTFFGNLRNTISYGGLSVILNFNYNLGYFVRRPSIDYYAMVNTGDVHPDFANRWQNLGDELSTSVPSFKYPLPSRRDEFYKYADVNVVKGDHIRLQDIYAEYNLNSVLGQSSWIKDLSLFVNVANMNLILWKSNDSGVDPNFPSGIPTPGSFSLGCRSTF